MSGARGQISASAYMKRNEMIGRHSWRHLPLELKEWNNSFTSIGYGISIGLFCKGSHFAFLLRGITSAFVKWVSHNSLSQNLCKISGSSSKLLQDEFICYEILFFSAGENNNRYKSIFKGKKTKNMLSNSKKKLNNSKKMKHKSNMYQKSKKEHNKSRIHIKKILQLIEAYRKLKKQQSKSKNKY